MKKFLISTLLWALAATGPASAQQPQVGFAHRVNDQEEIRYALASGANGIEIDICWGGGLLRPDTWYVSHNDFDVCANAYAQNLAEWADRLRRELIRSPAHGNRLVALWIDIKDLSDYRHLSKAVLAVRGARLPEDIKIIYDLTGYSDDSVQGFHRLSPILRRNEGISMCAGKSCGGDLGTVEDIYKLYKNNGFRRGGFNTGDSLNTDDRFLAEANKPNFNIRSDPYRFKFVHTWTNRSQDTMKRYLNQANSYRTTGQIVGEAPIEFLRENGYLNARFRSAVGSTAWTRLATRSDEILGTRYRPGDFGRLTTELDRNKCVDVIGGIPGDGLNLHIWECYGGSNQYWSMPSDGTMRNQRDASQCFDPEGPSYAEGTPLQVWECGPTYQFHAWTYHGDRTLRPTHAFHMCAGLVGARTSNGTPIVLQPCNGTRHQKWNFTN